MKSTFSAAMFIACGMLLSPLGKAQDCNGLTNWDLRGTYTMTGSGWIDPSILVPGAPSQTVPMSWAGALSYNGAGAGTGWVDLNAGGVQLTMDFVNLTYQVKADCSVAVSYSFKIRELGTSHGPVGRILVIGGNASALELSGISVGFKPGSPVDLMNARRISMQFK